MWYWWALIIFLIVAWPIPVLAVFLVGWSLGLVVYFFTVVFGILSLRFYARYMGRLLFIIYVSFWTL